MSSGGGWRVSAPLALVGGEGGGGIGTSTLVTCLGSQGTLCPCSPLMTRVGRPWTLLLLLVGPGPISLMHSARSNKSSSEGDTHYVFLVCFSVAMNIHLFIYLFIFVDRIGRPAWVSRCLVECPCRLTSISNRPTSSDRNLNAVFLFFFCSRIRLFSFR